MDDLFGQDIKLDATGQAAVTASGELLLTTAAETGVQDIRLQLFTPLGSLFYDETAGSLLHEWIKEESSRASRDAFAAEVERRIHFDPRVVSGSAECRILAWDATGLTASARWEFVDEDHPFNLIFGIDAAKQEMVIKDVNFRAGL